MLLPIHLHFIILGNAILYGLVESAKKDGTFEQGRSWIFDIFCIMIYLFLLGREVNVFYVTVLSLHFKDKALFYA